MLVVTLHYLIFLKHERKDKLDVNSLTFTLIYRLIFSSSICESTNNWSRSCLSLMHSSYSLRDLSVSVSSVILLQTFSWSSAKYLNPIKSEQQHQAYWSIWSIMRGSPVPGCSGVCPVVESEDSVTSLITSRLRVLGTVEGEGGRGGKEGGEGGRGRNWKGDDTVEASLLSGRRRLVRLLLLVAAESGW